MFQEKIKKRINNMFETGNFDFLQSIKIDKKIIDKLFHYQELHLYNLVHALNNNRVVLDGSDTGTGKTYVAIALCKHFNLRPLIIAPTIILSYWKNICTLFEVEPLLITSYEKIKRKNKINEYYETKFVNNKYQIIWKLPLDTIVLFDEVHKCGNRGTINYNILLSTKKLKNKILLISGTIADCAKSFCIYGYMLDLYKSVQSGHGWIRARILEDQLAVGITESGIHKAIFSNKGSKMCIKHIKDEFPENQIYAECYTIAKQYIDDVNNIFNSIIIRNNTISVNKKNSTNFFGDLVHMRMKLEKIKLNIISELAINYVENGYNIVIFVNFDNSVDELMTRLNTNCIIRGNQTNEEREKNINNFQTNSENIIICNIKSGAECISLHDINGRPRVSLISPSFSSLELKQALGRIYRIGTLSPALQRIIYCANTCEEVICNKLNEKLKFSGAIYDEDLIINNIQSQL
jgi:hypothetical protein